MLESLFNKFAGQKSCNLTPAQVFSCDFYDVFNITYFVEHLRTASYEEPF